MKKLLLFVCVLTFSGYAAIKADEALLDSLPFDSLISDSSASDFISADSSTSDSSAANSLSAARVLLAEIAASHIGTPYSSPANMPRTFDCSSFVSYVYGKLEYTLPRSTGAYANVGTRIDWEDALPGDILVFARQKGSTVIDHVALLWEKSASGELAGSQLIHAASINTGTSMLRGNTKTKTGIVITQLGLRGDGIIEKEYFYQRFMYCVRVLNE